MPHSHAGHASNRCHVSLGSPAPGCLLRSEGHRGLPSPQPRGGEPAGPCPCRAEPWAWAWKALPDPGPAPSLPRAPRSLATAPQSLLSGVSVPASGLNPSPRLPSPPSRASRAPGGPPQLCPPWWVSAGALPGSHSSRGRQTTKLWLRTTWAKPVLGKDGTSTVDLGVMATHTRAQPGNPGPEAAGTCPHAGGLSAHPGVSGAPTGPHCGHVLLGRGHMISVSTARQRLGTRLCPGVSPWEMQVGPPLRNPPAKCHGWVVPRHQESQLCNLLPGRGVRLPLGGLQRVEGRAGLAGEAPPPALLGLECTGASASFRPSQPRRALMRTTCQGPGPLLPRPARLPIGSRGGGGRGARSRGNTTSRPGLHGGTPRTPPHPGLPRKQRLLENIPGPNRAFA